MHERVYVERTAAAQARIFAAADTLAHHFELNEQLDALHAARDRDVQIAILKQREVIAGLLEALVEKVTGQPVEPQTVYVINEAVPEMTNTGEPNNIEINPSTVTVQEFRNARGEFVAADKQDADGKPEVITHAKRSQAKAKAKAVRANVSKKK